MAKYTEDNFVVPPCYPNNVVYCQWLSEHSWDHGMSQSQILWKKQTLC